MLRHLTLAAVAILAFTTCAQAEHHEKTKVKPGAEATEEMGKEVPKMKPDECADTAKKNGKEGIEPGKEVTEEMSKEVPDMTADAADCAKDGEKDKAKDNKG